MNTTKNKQLNKNKSNCALSYKKPHMIIPIDDMNWVLEQSPTVYRLFGECWKSDPFGSRYMPLSTTLKGDNLRKAKNVLKDAGLFGFEVKIQLVDGKRYYETFVINYHGSRSYYWKLKEEIDNPQTPSDNLGLDEETPSDSPQTPSDNLGLDEETPSDSPQTPSDNLGSRTVRRHVPTDSRGLPPESHTPQAFQKPSVSSHDLFKNTSKEIKKREKSFQVKKDEEQEKASSSLEDTPLTPEELLRHLKWAEQGTKPTEGVIEQIREDGRYWPAFVQYARLHEWDMRSEESSLTRAKEVIEQVKAKLKKAEH